MINSGTAATGNRTLGALGEPWELEIKRPDVLPLTDAEQRYLEILTTNLANAQASYHSFVGFLRKQHGAPAGQWELNRIETGFERIEGTDTNV